MIQMHSRDNQHSPVLVCDICRTPIRDAREGAAVFALSQDEGEAATGAVLHVHKHACHAAAEDSLGGRDNCAWQRLDRHMLYLAHNAGLPIAKLVDIARREGEFGI